MSLDSVSEYALSFSGEAVHLQKRDALAPEGSQQAQPAWRHLGSVDFEEPEFREMLGRLRMMATGEGQEVSLAVTLVIPDDQILYTTLTIAPSGDRERAVARSLDGLTPYPIEELSFDWEGDGDSVRVAAVARQTLREALEFARDYGFEGQRFCAAPEGEQFRGEPAFLLSIPERPRPRIDPALAGVTAAELMLPADVEDPAPEEASKEASAAPAADDQPAEIEAAPQPEADTVAPAEPDAEELAASASATLFAPESAPEAEAPASAPQPDGAEVAGADQLNPRALAVHQRAAEARQARLGGAAPSAPPRPRPVGHGRSHSGLVAMLVLLLVGLVAAWAFVVPGEREAPAVAGSAPEVPVVSVGPAAQAPVAEVAAGMAGEIVTDPAAEGGESAAALPPDVAVDPAEAPVTEASVTEIAEDEAPETPAAGLPAGEIPAAEAPAPAAPDEVDTAATAEPEPALPATTTAGSGPASLPAPETVQPQTIAELTPQEARRVLVAAAAVAAAVVPPSAGPAEAAAPATPTPVAPVREVAAAPATSSRAAAASPPRAAAVAVAPKVTTPRAQPRPERARSAATPAAPVREVARVVAPDPQLTSSARPQLSPRRSTPRTSVPRVDEPPRVPSDPMSYAASQLSARPPTRTGIPRMAERVVPASAPAAASTPAGSRAGRPPQRPEGSAPELIQPEGDDQLLDDADRRQLAALAMDLRLHGLPALLPASPDARLAEARPQRKPAGAATASDAVSASAIESAVRSAAEAPPERPAQVEAAAAPARAGNGAASLRGSSRPAARPSGGGRISDAAVEKAIAAAVDASPAIPNAKRLSALNASSHPPRRSDRIAAAPAVAGAAAADAAAAAAPAGPNEAELAARRALDEQLQAQAEARIRARAQADAAAEAQARAQAEARARAQAEAEERTARARKQEYKPPEVDDEPELAANVSRGGTTAANVAKSATQSRALDTGRTTIIGIIGAGNASRALIRLRNGRVVTVRLGDKIDGGTINSIGEGRVTYVKSGRQRELRLLDGR